MPYFLEYLLFCEKSGIGFLLLLVFGLIMIVIIYPGHKGVKGLVFAVTIAVIGSIGIISLKISSKSEINGDQYASLVKEANLYPSSKKHIRSHMNDSKYISKLDYCILMRHMKNLKAHEVNKKINKW